MLRSHELLETISLPGRDNYGLPSSQLSFPDGGAFGIELSSINNLKILETVLTLTDAAGVRVNRVDECRGIFRLPEKEISEMVVLCRERNIAPVFSIGPRAVYDTGGFVRAKNGVRVGYRLRGMDNVMYALDDVIKGVELGVRDFLVYDEGLLSVISKLRNKGELPGDIRLKLSVHSGCANPAAAALFSEVGADSINLVPDLELPMLSAVRQAVSCTLDIFSDTAADAGGMIRTPQIPEIIRLCAPVYLKCGAVSQGHQNHLPSQNEIEERVRQMVCVLETISRYAPELRQTTHV
ncbi:MAG: peptidase [Desulfobacteraceae bacterium]|nr:peptidase [Desulfobacteraceae bacterium]MBU3948986.1 peptidase [Pseudomonadota bacterium]MBU4055888.1 peptidase [Pseudomonadota bacterium]